MGSRALASEKQVLIEPRQVLEKELVGTSVSLSVQYEYGGILIVVHVIVCCQSCTEITNCSFGPSLSDCPSVSHAPGEFRKKDLLTSFHRRQEEDTGNGFVH